MTHIYYYYCLIRYHYW